MLLKRGILSWFTHPHVILLGKYHFKFEHQENHFIYMLNVIATLSNVMIIFTYNDSLNRTETGLLF